MENFQEKEKILFEHFKLEVVEFRLNNDRDDYKKRVLLFYENVQNFADRICEKQREMCFLNQNFRDEITINEIRNAPQPELEDL